MYDQYGHAAFEQGAGAGGFGGWRFWRPGGFGGAQGFDFSDIFSQMFGGGGSSGGRQPDYSGADLQVGIEISLEEAAKGVKKRINIPTYEECDVCHGSRCQTGHIRIDLFDLSRLRYGTRPLSHFPNAADLSDLSRYRQRNQRSLRQMPWRRPHQNQQNG